MVKFAVTVKETRQYLVTYLIEAQDQAEALAKAGEGDYEDIEIENYDYTLNTDWDNASIEKVEEKKQATTGGDENVRV